MARTRILPRLEPAPLAGPTPILHPVATVTVEGVTVPIDTGDVGLDEEWAPYCQATVTAPFDDPTLVEGIDPRGEDRAVITFAVDGHWEFTDDTGYIEDPAVPGSITPVEGP